MQKKLSFLRGPLIAGISATIIVGAVYAYVLHVHQGEYLRVDIMFGLPRIFLISAVAALLCWPLRRLNVFLIALVGGIVGLSVAVMYVFFATM